VVTEGDIDLPGKISATHIQTLPSLLARMTQILMYLSMKKVEARGGVVLLLVVALT
jgi:hypothetical protein